jgi:hypothetical protein
MTSTQTVALDAVRAKKSRSWPTFTAVLAGALLMTWPAFYNGFPLLYPDSMTYLGDGPVLARKIFLHQSSNYYGMRSFFYSLGIFPLHWNITAWPIVMAQAALIAYVLWLVVRSILPRRAVTCYLILIAGLSLLTSLSWYVSIIMPDILGPVLYLAFYLLVFARETLSRAERLTISGIACWAVTAHATHMMLAVALCVVLTLVLLLQRQPMQRIVRAAGEMGGILAIAAVAQLTLYGYIYGEPSLNGERPPYLMARLVADGTGRKYLEQHCGEVQWTTCTRVRSLAGDADHFLWDTDGGWGGASATEQKEMRREEMSFVLATVYAYPGEQLSKSMMAFWTQLQTFGIEDLDPSTWVADQFDEVLPAERGHYLASRQARNALHIEEFTAFHIWVVRSLFLATVSLLLLSWRQLSPRLVGLTIVIFFIVVANAFVTGTMSMVDERYGSRVIWLIPFLTGLLVMHWFFARRTPAQGQDCFSKNCSTSAMSCVRR